MSNIKYMLKSLNNNEYDFLQCQVKLFNLACDFANINKLYNCDSFHEMQDQTIELVYEILLSRKREKDDAFCDGLNLYIIRHMLKPNNYQYNKFSHCYNFDWFDPVPKRYQY